MPKILRYYHIINNEFNKIFNKNNESIKKQLDTKYGLKL